ncbi:MAG: hypothetical protein WDN44_10880 [Sphingomonas sp.]
MRGRSRRSGALSRAKRDALRALGNVLDEAVVERGRDRYRLARDMGLDSALDIATQVAAFENILAAAAPRRK